LRELDVEIVEEINPLDISVEQDGKGNATCLSKVERESNACDKADDIMGKQKIRQ
jgi:hypothetical protein